MPFETYCKVHYPQYEDNVSFWLGAADYSDGRTDCAYGLSGYGAIAWGEGWAAARRHSEDHPA
jgi:hypothetical protein